MSDFTLEYNDRFAIELTPKCNKKKFILPVDGIFREIVEHTHIYARDFVKTVKTERFHAS